MPNNRVANEVRNSQFKRLSSLLLQILCHFDEVGRSVPLPYLVIIRVVGWGNFQGSCAELSVHIIVCNYYDFSIAHWNLHCLTNKSSISVILMMVKIQQYVRISSMSISTEQEVNSDMSRVDSRKF